MQTDAGPWSRHEDEAGPAASKPLKAPSVYDMHYGFIGSFLKLSILYCSNPAFFDVLKVYKGIMSHLSSIYFYVL